MPFKLTIESIKCEVTTNIFSSILGGENENDLNSGLSRRAEVIPKIFIPLNGSQLNMMTCSRSLQLLNKWKKDWLFIGNPEKLTLRSLKSASDIASTPL
jgi:hypothetical protein